MSKTITVASKFSEEEIDLIDYVVQSNHTTRSALFHDLVMQGVKGEPQEAHSIPSNIIKVKFLFTENYGFFFEGRKYDAIINGDDASVFIGGSWKHYKLDELPVQVIEGE